MTDLESELSENSPVLADLAAAVKDIQPITGYFIRPETVFDRDSVFDSVSVFVLTPRFLAIIVTDVTYELSPAGDFVTTTQIVNLDRIADFQVIRRRVLEGPQAGSISTVHMRLRWGNGWGADIRPASCDDPTCEADHGYIAMGQGDDGEIVLDSTLSPEIFARGVEFIDQLSAALVQR